MTTLEIFAMVFSGMFSVMLGIIAYFSIKTLEKISTVDLKVTELYIKHDNTEERSRDNKKEIDRHWNELEKAKFRLHCLEGGQKSVLSMLREEGKA